MKKAIINSNHYLALAVSSCIFVCSILAFVFVYHQVGLQMQNTAVAYTKMNDAQLQENNAKNVVNTLAATQAQRALLESFFVRDDQTVGLITQIENVELKAGAVSVTIASISDDDLSAASIGTTGNIHAHINVKGPWPNAMRALHLLESLPYGESIDNLRVTPISDKEWNIEFDLNAVLIHE